MLSYISIALALTIASLATPLDILEPSTGGEQKCEDTKFDQNVTLAAGLNAGHFRKLNRSVHTMRSCLSRCCAHPSCDVALLRREECFLVRCRNLISCAPTREIDGTSQIAYIAREKTHTVSIGDGRGEPVMGDFMTAENVWESPSNIREIPFDMSADNIAKMSLAAAPSRDQDAKHWKDMILAIVCGVVATCVGVAGAIMMTRRLIDDDDDDDYDAMITTFVGGTCRLPDIAEEDDTDELDSPEMSTDLDADAKTAEIFAKLKETSRPGDFR